MARGLFEILQTSFVLAVAGNKVGPHFADCANLRKGFYFAKKNIWARSL
jgi:hypothetical protein